MMAAMKVQSFLFALVLAAPAFAQKEPAAKPKSSPTITRLDGSTITPAEAADFAANALKQNNVTGAQISVVHGGQLVWSYNYGLAGKNPNRAVDNDTTFAAASITKSYFATYVMQLVERGQFNLDKPLAEQLAKPLDQYDDWHNMSLLVADPRWKLVTGRMILSHTSGLPSGSSSDPGGKPLLHFQPGTHWLYSNIGINILALVIEQKFHRPLDQLMQEALFTPLGMTRTSDIDLPRLHPDVADRFDAKTGALIDRERPTVTSAAGSVTTSADDLAKLFTALFAGRILKPATRNEMLKPVIFIDSAHESDFSGHHPNDAEVKPIGFGYAVGWGVITRTKFGPAFFKEGHIDGANAYVICFTQSRDCMSILTNNDNGEHAYRALLEHILGDTVTPWEWEGYK